MKYNNTIAQGMKANFSGKNTLRWTGGRAKDSIGNTAFIGDVTLYIQMNLYFIAFHGIPNLVE